MTAPEDRPDSEIRAAIRAGAAHLRSTHWDGNGCGTNGTGGCSRCYGPSPADADEVAEDVLEAALPIFAARVAAVERERAAAEARLEAVKAATVGWFIDEDANCEATLWRENERHPVALCRQGDVAGEVWSLIVAALSVAPQPQPARECGNCGEPYPGRHIIERHDQHGALVICPRHTALGSTTATHDGFIGACDLCAVHPGAS